MKVLAIAVLAVIIYTAAGFPEQEGEALVPEVIDTLRKTQIGPNSEIQSVKPAIEIKFAESQTGKIDLGPFLSEIVPAEVIANLQQRVDGIGYE
ncbi:uncharacterized protein LOC141531844 [Cotesia typhae]